jgi:hypothetical protein
VGPAFTGGAFYCPRREIRRPAWACRTRELTRDGGIMDKSMLVERVLQDSPTRRK